MEVLAQLPTRIASRILVGAENSCWLWSGCCNGDGYGLAKLKGSTVRVARLVLEAKLGRKLDKAEETRHSCDVRLCCNPSHLEAGSHVDNILDRTERGRAARGNKHGSQTHPECLPRGVLHRRSKLTEEKVRLIFELHAQGFIQRAIAARVGCCQSNVNFILRGKGWNHVLITPR